MKRLGKAALAAVTLTGMLSAFTTAASASASDPSTFSMFIIDDGHGFDPSVITWEVYQDSLGIFEGLSRPSAHGPVPGIASSWTHNKNNTVWTFKLRPEAKFSNGDPITAQDFVFSFVRAADPVTSVRAGAGMAVMDPVPIVNEPQIRAGKIGAKALGVKALDDHTFQIKLYRPDPTLVRDLTLPTSGWAVPLDPKVVNSMYKKDWANASKIVSDGPYMIQSYRMKTQATLVPNPYYYGKVNLKQITFMYSSGATGLIDYKSGALDAALLNSTDVPAVLADPTLKSQLHFFPTSVQYSLEMSPSPMANNPLLNVNVRKALMMAVDRDTISKNVLQGTGVPAYEYFSPTWLDPWIKKGAIPYNPTEAKKLLAKAGYPNGKGFPTVYITVGVSGQPDIVAQAIQQMWQQNLGINVKYNGMEYGQFSSTYNKPMTDGVGFRQASGNMKYPQLLLPTSVENFLDTQQALFTGYLPPAAYAQFYKLDQNQSLSPTDKYNQENVIFEKYLPKDIMSWINLGVKAFQTNNNADLEKYFLYHEQNVFDIPVYTPLQPVLIRPGIKGYAVNSFLLTAPPTWLNDITRS